jgi:hypothetical protein
MGVDELERLSCFYTETQIKVKEQHLYSYSTFNSQISSYNIEHNSYSKMSLKRPLACICEVLSTTVNKHYIWKTSVVLMLFG